MAELLSTGHAAFPDAAIPAFCPDCSSFEAARRSVAGMGERAFELSPFRDEPPQMASGSVGKAGYLRLDFRRDFVCRSIIYYRLVAENQLFELIRNRSRAFSVLALNKAAELFCNSRISALVLEDYVINSLCSDNL